MDNSSFGSNQSQTQSTSNPKVPISLDLGIIVTVRIEAIKPDDSDNRVLTFNYNSRWFILRAVSLPSFRKIKKLEIGG